jgi:uncharacterized protein YbjT (DUF2867 family)
VPSVLVTGGSGCLGSYLVPRLLGRGHEVRVLSRRDPSTLNLSGADAARGDVASGEGLVQALRDVDVVVHAATLGVRPGARRTEVQGTKNMLEASRRAGAHFIYVSIVGVDRHRLPYYRAKWAAEQVVEASPGRWTIQRATQFHDLLAAALKGHVLPATKHLRFQPVDAGEVSDRLIDLVDSRQPGRASDFGGPEIVPVRQIAATWRDETGRRAAVLPVPALHFLADFDSGYHLCPRHTPGKVTWREWVHRHTSASR